MSNTRDTGTAIATREGHADDLLSEGARSLAGEKLEKLLYKLRYASEEEAADVRQRLMAYEIYARARSLREEYEAAGEARLWAERRLGELRRDIAGRGEFVTHLDARVGLSGWNAKQIEKLATIPKERFIEILEEIKLVDGAMSVRGVLARADKAYERRLEYGIYQLEDGRLALQYKASGVKRREVLGNIPLAVAREKLAQRTGHWQARKNVGKGGLSSANSYVRSALVAMDITTKGQPPEVKKAVDDARSALHKANDTLLFAINHWSF